MKVSIKWIRDYVAVSLSVAELAERLAMAGTEVKGMKTIPRVSSTLRRDQAFTPDRSFQESPSQVSWPTSPGRGTE